MARVSAPAKARSESTMPLSAPRYRPSRMISAARGGPIVSSVTLLPGKRSLSCRACSRALRSSGLKMAGSADRFMVPSSFIASLPTLRVSGTCLASTIMLKLMSYGFKFFYDSEPNGRGRICLADCCAHSCSVFMPPLSWGNYFAKIGIFLIRH